VDGASPFPVDVLGDVGQQCDVTERADHRDRLVNVDALEHAGHLGPLDLRATHPKRRDPGPLDEIEDLVAVLLADGVAQDGTQQPDVLAHRFGRLTARAGPLDRADRLQTGLGNVSHQSSIRARELPRATSRTAQTLYLIRSA
jgi:hypothetical protein